MRRIDALELINRLTGDYPVVVTCAATSRELASIENRENHLYVLDSMGLVTSIATGLALQVSDTSIQKVIGIEGDGSLLMNLNSLPTAGYLAPEKLLIVLLDNESYGSTAGLPTYSPQIDLADLGVASGWKVLGARSPDDLCAQLAHALTVSGPTLLHVKIEPGNAQGIAKLLVDPVSISHRFTAWLEPHMATLPDTPYESGEDR